jgi:hypothetical protein
MPSKYEPRSLTIESLLSWIKSGEIAIPEIQRPFVWEPRQVIDLLDSLLKGYPVGYLITWKSPDVNLKDGSRSEGKKILIDGQQRITALTASILARPVVTKDYQRKRIQVAFNPQEQRFDIYNSVIARSNIWIPDISPLFEPSLKRRRFISDYCERNPQADPDAIDDSINALVNIITNPIGVIELDSSLDIDTVTDIFIRVNSSGVPLSQADFAMSKIAVNDNYDGSNLRKAIDYFCHLSIKPEFYTTLEHDAEFVHTYYFRKMAWLRSEKENLYDPSYSDMLRVIFASHFLRGRLQDLVALLSGRNFETRQFEEIIIEDTFAKLREGILDFINETHFKRFIMIVRSAGFVDSSLISSQMALNFAYILYLTLRRQEINHAEIERQVRRWFVMSVLTSRYTGSFETTIEQDINQIASIGIAAYADQIMRSQLSDAFWEAVLPQLLTTSSISGPVFNVFRAAQVKLGDKGFLSRDISVRELVEYKSDMHHLFPKDLLKKRGLSQSQYNQIANYVVAQSEINIQIGSKAPATYFQEMWQQVQGGPQRYGNITTPQELRDNLAMHCIPEGVESMTLDDYPSFLVERRRLMALKIKAYFDSL